MFAGSACWRRTLRRTLAEGSAHAQTSGKQAHMVEAAWYFVN